MSRLSRALEYRVGRARRAASFRVAGLRRTPADYLFVCGPEGAARRYRCDHQAEQLRLAGRSAHVGYRAELDLVRLVDRYRTFVLYRVPWDDEVAKLVEIARSHGRRVLADVDDLVFDPGSAHEIRALESLGTEARQTCLDAVERLRETLSAADGVVVSTEPLAGAARRLNRRVTVVPNVVSAEMVSAARRTRDDRREEITIAYLSGTPTHDHDFLEASSAVLSVLDEFPAVRLLVVGYLGLDARFARVGERITRAAAVPWRRLPRILASIDVNLAPLEQGNRFTDGKSAIKYLEASLLGVPTVASPRADFRRVIEGGRTGLLAEDEAEWRDALAQLMTSAARRESIGAAARKDVLANHTTAARAAATAEAFTSAA